MERWKNRSQTFYNSKHRYTRPPICLAYCLRKQHREHSNSAEWIKSSVVPLRRSYCIMFVSSLSLSYHHFGTFEFMLHLIFSKPYHILYTYIPCWWRVMYVNDSCCVCSLKFCLFCKVESTRNTCEEAYACLRIGENQRTCKRRGRVKEVAKEFERNGTHTCNFYVALF